MSGARQQRFSGHLQPPQAAAWCDNCGGDICLGCAYYVHEGWNICTGCAREYAWARFEETARRRFASPPTPLVMRREDGQ